MGIGKQRKREEQEETMENRRLQEAAEADTLIGRIAPDTQPLLPASSTNQLPPGENQTVMPRVTPDGKQVEFMHGEIICGTVEIEIAQDLEVPLDATYFEVVSDEDDVLMLRARPVDRRSLRPRVEDEDEDD